MAFVCYFENSKGTRMTKDEALRLALEALIEIRDANIRGLTLTQDYYETITAIKAALETPQRTWVRLTDDEIVLIVAECAASHQHTDIHFARGIEAKLKAKNT